MPLAPTRASCALGRPRNFRGPLLALACALLAGSSARAQILTGTVVDGAFGGGLPAANVAVFTPGTATPISGSATDLDGRYRIAGLAPGTYDVAFSFTGYATQRVTGLTLAQGEVRTLDVTLQEEAVEIEEEVVVTADAILDNDAALLRDRQRSVAVSDAIGAETISRSGAGNAADAVERVTGASVQGGRYVYVRGLGDRYANTQLNGADLPTADPDRRAVQFDLFPSDFLENIVTLKTFTPDRPGNFSGGLVDINTRSFPDRLSVSASVSGGLSTQAAPGDAALADPVGGVNLFATGAGDFALPEELDDVDETVPSSGDVLFDQAAAERLDRLTRFFTSRPVAPRVDEADPNFSLGLSVGNRVNVLGNALGFVLGLTADQGTGFYEQGSVGRFDVLNREGGASPRLRQLRLDSRATYESSLGGLANFTYRLGSRNEVGLNTLYSRSAESEARFIAGLAPIPIGSEGDSIQVVDRVLGYTERQLISSQLRGRHQLPSLAGLGVDWRANYSRTDLDEPDRRFFANSIQENEDGDLVYGTGGGNLDNALHYFRTLNEDLGGLALDLTLPPRALADLPVQIKVGGLVQRSEREFRERRLEVQFHQNLLLGGVEADSVEAFFADENAGIIAREPGTDPEGNPRTRFRFGHQLTETTLPGNQYDGVLDVGAAYAMAEFPLLPRLRVIGGARFERTDLRVESQRVDSLIVVGSDTTQVFLGSDLVRNDVLPSLNLVYGLSENMNLRVAATRTLARPTFREISPVSTFDFATDAPLEGNVELDRTLITNLDLRWEWFNAPGAILAVSGYYKLLDNPIERVIRDFEVGTTEYRNVDEATIYGAEVEARQRLGALGGVFGSSFVRDLSLGGNVTFTRSRITIDPEELVERRLVDPAIPDTRQLQGQSPYLVNLDLAYDNAASGTAAGVYFNVFGRRLSRVGAGAVDVFEKPSPQLDLIASQRLLSGFAVKFSVKNLLAYGTREVYDFPEASLVNIGGQEAVYQSYERGTSFSLGISFSPRFGGGSPADAAIPPPGADPVTPSIAPGSGSNP